jgi:purine-nucleoside phosphorylase
MTPHNSAPKGAIAPFVLLPGDPLRAQWVASQFLTDVKEVTSIRNMLGFSGIYKGCKVSVLGSGMGGPSAGIYSYELFDHYEVEAIIRIGTCGGFATSMNPGDIIFPLTASTDSNWAHQYSLMGTYSPSVDYPLLERAVEITKKEGLSYYAGMVFSSDLFSSYSALGEKCWEKWALMGALAQDMETYALYSTAAYLNKRALSILTMTDNCATGISFEDDQRMEGNRNMAHIALETIIQQT